MDTKVTVVAGTEGKVPMEENSRRFIGATPVEITLSSYYRRRMADGELVLATPAPAAPAKPAKVNKAETAPVIASVPKPEVK